MDCIYLIFQSDMDKMIFDWTLELKDKETLFSKWPYDLMKGGYLVFLFFPETYWYFQPSHFTKLNLHIQRFPLEWVEKKETTLSQLC